MGLFAHLLNTEEEQFVKLIYSKLDYRFCMILK